MIKEKIFSVLNTILSKVTSSKIYLWILSIYLPIAGHSNFKYLVGLFAASLYLLAPVKAISSLLLTVFFYTRKNSTEAVSFLSITKFIPFLITPSVFFIYGCVYKNYLDSAEFVLSCVFFSAIPVLFNYLFEGFTPYSMFKTFFNATSTIDLIEEKKTLISSLQNINKKDRFYYLATLKDNKLLIENCLNKPIDQQLISIEKAKLNLQNAINFIDTQNNSSIPPNAGETEILTILDKLKNDQLLLENEISELNTLNKFEHKYFGTLLKVSLSYGLIEGFRLGINSCIDPYTISNATSLFLGTFTSSIALQIDFTPKPQQIANRIISSGTISNPMLNMDFFSKPLPRKFSESELLSAGYVMVSSNASGTLHNAQYLNRLHLQNIHLYMPNSFSIGRPFTDLHLKDILSPALLKNFENYYYVPEESSSESEDSDIDTYFNSKFYEKYPTPKSFIKAYPSFSLFQKDFPDDAIELRKNFRTYREIVRFIYSI